MTVNDFRKGDKVTMTKEALEMALEGKHNRRRGVVIGHSRNGLFIRVLRSGMKQSETYAPQFWKKI
jgi:hypothetical protein